MGINLAYAKDCHSKNILSDCKKITLSGVEAPDVTPIVMGPSGSQFSFSTNSPC